jgi:urate oxidase / 2-oxo-4-hydroxy-4-carboxy-5-ureidoimidazoline decarboxylase
MDSRIYYGKGNIALYRSYASALTGLTPIPESPYTGQENTLFAVDLDVEVFGDVFMPAYTAGDNSMVVPTATMTNFALKQALGFEGATLESFLHYLAQAYLNQYPQMESVRLSAKELPFLPQPITNDGGKTVAPSDRLLAPSHDSYAFAQLGMDRSGITDHQCGQLNMKLIKLTGSAFANFVQDEYTTLPQRNDRPLYIYLDMGWRYTDVNDAVNRDHTRYIAPQQVHDHLIHTFHDFVSMSIQHLVYEMGIRLLRRFPQMGEVWFKAQNRLWDTAAESAESNAKVYMDPRPPYGMIGLKLTRDDLKD